jgi:hypothetical protein
VLSVGYGPTVPTLAATPGNHIAIGGFYTPGTAAMIEWTVPSGYVICSARVQLADGSWAAPTGLLPHATPTPRGGWYEETSNPASRFTAVAITAAKSPVAPGTSCNYPIESTFFHTLAKRGPRPLHPSY